MYLCICVFVLYKRQDARTHTASPSHFLTLKTGFKDPHHPQSSGCHTNHSSTANLCWQVRMPTRGIAVSTYFQASFDSLETGIPWRCLMDSRGPPVLPHIGMSWPQERLFEQKFKPLDQGCLWKLQHFSWLSITSSSPSQHAGFTKPQLALVAYPSPFVSDPFWPRKT